MSKQNSNASGVRNRFRRLVAPMTLATVAVSGFTLAALSQPAVAATSSVVLADTTLAHGRTTTATISGVFDDGEMTAVVTIPSELSVRTAGTYPMTDDDGVVSGTMTVDPSGTVTFTRDPDYATSHPLDADFSGTITIGVASGAVSDVEGGHLDLVIDGVPVSIDVEPCPTCSDSSRTYKWTDVDDATGTITSGVVIGTRINDQYAGGSCTVTDVLGEGQTGVSAYLDYMGRVLDSDDDPSDGLSLTWTPSPDSVVEMRVTAMADASHPGPFTDRATITCNGVEVTSQGASTTWHDASAHGGGQTSPVTMPPTTETPEPSTPETPETPESSVPTPEQSDTPEPSGTPSVPADTPSQPESSAPESETPSVTPTPTPTPSASESSESGNPSTTPSTSDSPSPSTTQSATPSSSSGSQPSGLPRTGNPGRTASLMVGSLAAMGAIVTATLARRRGDAEVVTD